MRKNSWLVEEASPGAKKKALYAWMAIVFVSHNFFVFTMLPQTRAFVPFLVLSLLAVLLAAVVLAIRKKFPLLFAAPALRLPLLLLLGFCFLVLFVHHDSLTALGWQEFLALLATGWGLAKSFFITILFFASCYGLGRKILGLLGLGGMEKGKSALFSVGLGLGVASLAMYALAAASLAYGWAAWTLILAMAALSWREIASLGNKVLKAKVRIFGPNLDGFEKTLVLLLGALFFLELFSSLATILSAGWDSFHQYLLFPMEYAKQHRLVFFPYHPYWGFPQAGEMVFLSGLLLGGQKVLFLQNFAFCLLALSGLYSLLGRVGKRWRLWMVACVAIFPPFLFYSFGYIKIEPLFAFLVSLVFLALHGVFKDEEARGKYWVLLSLVLGLSLCVKYTAVVLIFSVFIALLPFKKRLGLGAKKWALMAAILAVLLLPWLAKNAWYYQQPFYPILPGKDFVVSQVGLQCNDELKSLSAEDVFLVHNNEHLRTSRGLESRILLAGSMLISPNGMEIGDYGFAIILFLPLVLLFFFRIRDRFVLAVYGVSFVYFLLWLLLFAGQSWYLIPSFFGFVLILGHVLSNNFSKGKLRLPQALIIAWLFFGLSMVVVLNGGIREKAGFIRGSASYEDTLASYHARRQDKSFGFFHQFSMRKYVNEVILKENPAALIYGLSETRGLLFDNPQEVLVPDFYNYLWNCLRQDGRRTGDLLRSMGVTHILAGEGMGTCIYPEVAQKFKMCQANLSFREFIREEGLVAQKRFGNLVLYRLPVN